MNIIVSRIFYRILQKMYTIIFDGFLNPSIKSEAEAPKCIKTSLELSYIALELIHC